MRLLNIYSFDFREFHSASTTPPYVITSHRWTDDETTYKDVKKRRNTESKGYRKVAGFCFFLRNLHNVMQWNHNRAEGATFPEWVWIDTACIDQRSSAEVSESINSMWSWYSNAKFCFAYLADVRRLRAGKEVVDDDFRRSEWFTRGWTLQELLAPSCLFFVSKDWELIGQKQTPVSHIGLPPRMSVNQIVAEITGIPEKVLFDYRHAASLTFDAKMAWMDKRTTTRIEDLAYCLLGIFDVHMPLIYGEGLNALGRLKEEIAKKGPQARISDFGPSMQAATVVQQPPTRPATAHAEPKPRPVVHHRSQSQQSQQSLLSHSEAPTRLLPQSRKRTGQCDDPECGHPTCQSANFAARRVPMSYQQYRAQQLAEGVPAPRTPTDLPSSSTPSSTSGEQAFARPIVRSRGIPGATQYPNIPPPNPYSDGSEIAEKAAQDWVRVMIQQDAARMQQAYTGANQEQSVGLPSMAQAVAYLDDVRNNPNITSANAPVMDGFIDDLGWDGQNIVEKQHGSRTLPGGTTQDGYVQRKHGREGYPRDHLQLG